MPLVPLSPWATPPGRAAEPLLHPVGRMVGSPRTPMQNPAALLLVLNPGREGRWASLLPCHSWPIDARTCQPAALPLWSVAANEPVRPSGCLLGFGPEGRKTVAFPGTLPAGYPGEPAPSTLGPSLPHPVTLAPHKSCHWGFPTGLIYEPPSWSLTSQMELA